MTNTPHTAAVVKASLADGNRTARDVQTATGLAHEAVYAALVWLEARGMAFMYCPKRGTKRGSECATWETQ